MLPFRVIQLEQYRALQQSAAKPYLQGFFPLPELSSKRNFATPSRRLSGPFSPGDFAASGSRNMARPTLKNEAVFQSGCTTSTRFWSKSRSYRKQTIKPFLPGATTAPQGFRKFPKLTPKFDAFSTLIPSAKTRGIT
jgi:hypothetical protein